MIVALKGDEASARYSQSQLAAGLDWDHKVPPRMHYECRRLHFWENIGNVQIADEIEVSGSALRRGGSALQFIEKTRLLVGSARDEQAREHLRKLG